MGPARRGGAPGDQWLLTLLVSHGGGVDAADRWADKMDPGEVPPVGTEVGLPVRLAAFLVRGRPVARLEWGAESAAEPF